MSHGSVKYSVLCMDSQKRVEWRKIGRSNGAIYGPVLANRILAKYLINGLMYLNLCAEDNNLIEKWIIWKVLDIRLNVSVQCFTIILFSDSLIFEVIQVQNPSECIALHTFAFHYSLLALEFFLEFQFPKFEFSLFAIPETWKTHLSERTIRHESSNLRTSLACTTLRARTFWSYKRRATAEI